MSDPVSFDDVVNFVRDFTGIGGSRPITCDTRLEADLGVTGDDGDELLEEAARHFNAALASPREGYRTTFNLKSNEYLFSEEGVDLFGICALIRWFQGEPRPVVRDLTLGQLHDAIVKTKRGGEDR